MKRSLICLCLFSIVYPATAGQPRYRLREVSAPGDVSITDAADNMEMSLHARTNGQNVPDTHLSRRGQERYREQVLAVDTNGKETAIRRTYSAAREVNTEGGQTKTLVHSYQGKTVTIRRVGSQIRVTADKGTLTAADRKELQEKLNHVKADFYPKREVAIGEEWTTEVPAGAMNFGKDTKATAHGKIVEITSYGSHRCARLQVTIELTGKPDGLPAELTMRLDGQLYYALDIDRMLSGDFRGPTTVKGESTQQGATIKITGEGEWRMVRRVRYVKVAGNPVAP